MLFIAKQSTDVPCQENAEKIVIPAKAVTQSFNILGVFGKHNFSE